MIPNIVASREIPYYVDSSCHKDVFHNIVKETLVRLRRRFWVPQARSLLRKIVFKCVLCHRLEGKSYCIPPPRVLPTFRVNEGHAFESVGCDLCGPVYCKTETGTVKSQTTTTKCCSRCRIFYET